MQTKRIKVPQTNIKKEKLPPLLSALVERFSVSHRHDFFWLSKNDIVTKLYDSNWDKTQIATKLKYQQNSKTPIVIKKEKKIKRWQNDKTQIRTKLIFWQNLKILFLKNNLTPRQPMRCTLGRHLQSYHVCSICWMQNHEG